MSMATVAPIVAAPAAVVHAAVDGDLSEKINAVFGFFGHADILISQAEIKRQIRLQTPIVFPVKVVFLNPVFQEERSEAFGESSNTTIKKGVETTAIVDCVTTGGAEIVKAPRVAVGEVVKVLPPDVCSNFKEVGTGQ